MIGKVFKVFLWILAGLLALVIALVVFINLPAGQNLIKNQVIRFLKNKTNTEISLERLRIRFPRQVELNKFFIADQKKDTLLYTEKLLVDINMFALLSNKVELSNIELQTVNANVYRNHPDTTFNYQFLVDSLLSNQTKTKEEVKKDSTAALVFNLDKIVFQNIRLTFKDDVVGNSAGVYMGRLGAKVHTFDLNQMHYVLDKFELSNTRLLYNQQKPLTVLHQAVTESIAETEQEKGGALPLIEFRQLLLDKVHLNYDDKLSDTRATLGLNEMNFKNALLDLTHGKYKLSDGALNHSVIDFAYRPTPANEAVAKKTADSAKTAAFSLYVDNIALHNNTVRYNNLAQPHVKGRLDYNHLAISSLGITAKDVAIDSAGIRAGISGGQLRDSSGFVLHDIKGKLLYDDTQLRIDNFIVKTPYTFIDNTSALTYTAKDDLSKHPEKVKLAVHFRNTVLHMQDMYYIVHSVPASYKKEKINLTAALTGYLNNLSIDKFFLQGLKNTQVNITGNIKGLPDMKRTFYDVHIGRLQTSKSDLQAFIPATAFPKDINLPNHIAAQGTFKGSATHFTTQLNVATDMGTAKITGRAQLATGKETYDAAVQLNRFNVGHLLKNKEVGHVSLAATIKGRGITPKKMNAALKGTIYSAMYNGYTYKNVRINGTYQQQQAVVAASSTDTNVHFNLTARVGLAGKKPAIKATADLKKIDLQKLNFVKDELKLAGIADIDFTNTDPDYLNGTAYLHKLQIVKDGQAIHVDTISIQAVATAAHNSLQLHSEILTAHLQGKYQLTQVGQAFINQLNQYYTFGKTKRIAPQQMQFDIAVHDARLIQQMVPKLHYFAPATFTGVLNTERDSLILKGNFPHIIYDSFTVRQAVLDVHNTRDTHQLNYAVNIKSVESPSLKIYNSQINGAAANDQLGINMYIRDSKDKDKYVVSGRFQTAQEVYRFSLNPQNLVLNYDPWQVAADNLIQYSKEGLYVRNFSINNNGQALAINSMTNTTNAPLKVQFDNFRLETLTRYADQDTAMVGGALNGTVVATDVTASPKFETDLTIAHLRYKKDSLGNASIKINNHTKNAFQTDIALTGLHDIHVAGLYYTAPSSALDATITINKIDLKHIESLSGGQISNGSGFISGALTAKGALDAPQLLGNIRFNNAGMNITKLNSYYRLSNETIALQNEGIRFNQFTIRDSMNQPVVVDGIIYTSDYKKYAFNLNVNANNFRVMNSTVQNNSLFYGTVFMNLKAHIGGNMDKPDATFEARINKDTKFTFVVPDNGPAVADQEGVVLFVDKSAPPYNGREALNIDSATRGNIRGMDISGNISIDKDAEITVVVDPQNGDALRVKGQADLSVQMDPSGKVSLTGRYEISDGGYNLSIGGLARREFKIRQGSSIQWTGAPTDGNVDITAIYEVNTSPIDLVADQVQGLDQNLRTRYRQQIPFLLYLKMQGALLNPKIAFELDMPENERNAFNGIVYTRIQQINSNESDLNKQVFALLALNRFISDNPFQSLAGGATASSIARQSVSRFLTEQLNNVAADLIKGVEINFELNSGEDYSTGTEQTRTDLNVAFTKRLLNDRLSITVGNNFALEGQRANQQAAVIAGNINIEYQLSRDGRYRIRAYRRNQTEGIIEGQIIETGLGFTMVVDYNRFRELFQRAAREDSR